MIVGVAALGLAGLALVVWLALGGAREAHAPAGGADATERSPRPRGREAAAALAPRGGRPDAAISPVAVRDPAAGAGTLEGLVLSWETNEPIADAELTFAHDGAVSSTMSDAAGGFSYRASEPGAYELATVVAEGFLPFAPEWGHSPIRLEARPGIAIRDIVIHLRPAAEYDGLVVAPDGAPVEGAEVVVLTSRLGQGALAPLPERFTSDAGGRFRFQAPPGALLEARHPDHAPGRATVDSRAQLRRRVTIELRPGRAEEGSVSVISGRVVDDAGRPVAGALVEASFGGPLVRGVPPAPAQALSDERGEFLLEGLDEGRYHLRAEADGWAPASLLAVPAGTGDVVLALRAGATISGVVTDGRTGEPVPGFSVVVERLLGPLRRVPYRTESFFDAEGRYEVTGLDPREYLVSATAHGYSPSAPTQVRLDAARTEARADFTLSRGGSASGVVVDAESGEAVAGAQVSIEAAPGRNDETPVPVTARSVTDAAGRFEIRGLEPGRRSLVVTAEGYHRRLVTGLEVSDDGSLGPLEVELSPTGEGEDPGYELTGIGAVLAPRLDELVIVRIIDGGGAAEAGLAPGDAIRWIDGAQVVDLGFTGAIERIRGPEGTFVRLGVRRASGEEADITVARRMVRG